VTRVAWSPPDRRHFAFFSFPGFGHVRPVLPVMAELLGRGHRVTHFVAERLADTARRPGVRVVPYASEFPEPFGRAESVSDAVRMLADLLTEGFAPLTEALRVLDDDRPDVLLHDDIGAHTARLLSWRWNVPVIRLYAHFANHVRAGQPVPGNGISPDEVMNHPALRTAWQRKFDELGELGYGMRPVMDALMRDDAAAEIVFVPREFHPDGEFSDRYFFVGSSPDPAVEKARWSPPPGRRVALISLGTAQAAAPEFFRRCAAAFAGTDWHVVMTLGSRVAPEMVGPVPENVELHQWLTHGAVLPHATVYFGAAGMSSLLESLSCGTPVIAVPHTDEQRANADRITELGLGGTIEPGEIGPATVFERAEAVAGDPEIARRVKEMSGHLAAAGGAPRAADVIERCSHSGD
jgi:MGT family glycosyltransferase